MQSRAENTQECMRSLVRDRGCLLGMVPSMIGLPLWLLHGRVIHAPLSLSPAACGQRGIERNDDEGGEKKIFPRTHSLARERECEVMDSAILAAMYAGKQTRPCK